MNSERSPPNILLIVWDACRYDYAEEHASFLNHLAASNLSFERAYAPSPWSLPSHASMFSGDLPHEHASNRYGDGVDTPLVSGLSEHGYTTYGVSANGFASQRTGFNEDFDEFRYTGGRDLFVDGMDVSGYSQGVLRDEDGSFGDAFSTVLRRIPRNDHRLKSIANLAAVGLGEIATKFERFQRIPHPIFAPTSDYSYSPGKNTRMIREFINNDNNDSIFLFTNYMDTHRCYKPNSELQRKHLGRTVGYKELVRLNEEVAAPWSFESKKECGDLDEEDLATLQGLYAGEVESADRHLNKVYETLKENDLLEDTLIVITADHGENLGKTDEMNRRRFGHEASVSDAVLHVPLVLAHPSLDEASISKPVSLDSLAPLFLEIAANSNVSKDLIKRVLFDRPAVSQYPATGGANETIQKYPDASEQAVRYRSSENSVIVYDGKLKIIVESTGDRWAFNDMNLVNFSEAPSSLVSLAENHLDSLQYTSDDNLSERQVSQLEALGYI